MIGLYQTYCQDIERWLFLEKGVSEIRMSFMWLSDDDFQKAAKKHICTGAYHKIMCRLIVNHDRSANILIVININHRRRSPSFKSIHINALGG